MARSRDDLERANKQLAQTIEALRKEVEKNTSEIKAQDSKVKRSVVETNNKFLGIKKLNEAKPEKPVAKTKIAGYEVSGKAVAAGAAFAALIPKLMGLIDKAMTSLDRTFNMTHLDAQEKTKQTVMQYARQGMEVSDKDIAWIYHQYNDQNHRAYKALTDVERVTHRSGLVPAKILQYTGFDVDRYAMEKTEAARAWWENSIDKQQMLEYQASKGSQIAKEKIAMKRAQQLAEINTNQNLTESN